MNVFRPSRVPAESAAAPDLPPPPWTDAMAGALATRAQVVLSGNVRDLFPVPQPGGPAFLGLEACLWHMLSRQGVEGLLVHDPVEGLRLHPACDPGLAGPLEAAGIPLGSRGPGPDGMRELVTAVMDAADLPLALLIDYAGPLLRGAGARLDQLLVPIDRLSRGPDLARPAAKTAAPPRNPLLWVVERPGDLPDWFAVGNETVCEISVGLPDLEERHAYAAHLARGLTDADAMAPARREAALEAFALETEGMTLTAMRAVAATARAEGHGLARIGAALRSFRIGTRRNPWTSRLMRQRVARGTEILSARVQGQETAIARTMEILERSVMGLSGAQSAGRKTRPRGVLFFAGPTGVGKTELAKGVTELLFGDETACHRFDMSEFMNESALTRLVGAPPGHPGHALGGELTNAVRARPFSVILFDEIEKAHPRILDTFLQILDEGRLTDSRGETAHFTESLIIFTSNVGVIGGDRATNMGLNVLPSDDHAALEAKIVKSVREFFRFEMKRPELMGRIGQNVVVFDFIHPRSALMIFVATLERVLATVAAEHGVEVHLSEDAFRTLEQHCTADLFDGGRGIANRVETHFINPLAHALFERAGAGRVRVTDLSVEDGRTRLTLA